MELGGVSYSYFLEMEIFANTNCKHMRTTPLVLI